MSPITLNTQAKLNLTLDILGKLEYGYHKIETILHQINLHDIIQLRDTTDDKIKLKCDIKELENINNLAYKSALLLKNKFKINKGIEIFIKKNIPIASGLGGGSADAAAVLVGLTKIWNLNLDNDKLLSLAREIGTDVPFFINGGTAFAYNKGEIAENIVFKQKLNFLLVNPGIKISTKYAYSIVDINKTGKKKSTQKMLNAIKGRENIPSLLYNDFEQFIFKKYPQLIKIKEDLINAGALNALMTGSGATIFGIFEDKDAQLIAYEKLKNKYKFVSVNHSIG